MTELVSTFDRLSMHQHHGSHVSIDASSTSSSSTNKKPAPSSSSDTRLPPSSSTADSLALPDMRRQSQPSATTSQAPPPPSLPLSSSFAFQPAPAPVQAQSIPLSSYTLSEFSGDLSAPPVQRSLSEDSFTHGLPYSDHHRYQSSAINASHSNPNLNGQYLNTQPSNHQMQPQPSSYQQPQQQQQQSSYRNLDYDYASMPKEASGANMAPRFYGSTAPRQDPQSFASNRLDASLDWLTRPPHQQPHSMPHLHQQQHLHHQQSITSPPGVAFDGTNYSGMMRGPPQDDEVIPTAIVIKNIPFQVPKEQLLAVMEDLRLPAPFAFNYHFDNGQFRGLAFANFRNASDASLCVSALNGFDLQGRKLRTEFKKVLKEGEKEKIEREKALKRMRSTRELHNGMGMGVGMGMGGVGFGPDGGPPPPPPGWMRRENSASDRGGFGNVAPINTDDDDYGRPVQGPYSSAFGGGPSTSFGTREYVPAPPPPPQGMNGGDGVWGRFNGSSPAGPTSSGNGPAPSSGQYSTSPPSDVGTSISARMTQTTSTSSSDSGGGRSGSSGPIELDMNDSQTLDIYSRVVVFKDDFLREEFAFARSLSANQRKIVHLVARKLELGHRSVGAGEDRHVVVYKPSVAESPALRGMSSNKVSDTALRHIASSLIRQPSRDTLNSYLNSTATSSTSYSNQSYSSRPMGSFKPSTNTYSLHAKKSMPDIRNTHPGSRRSNLNLRQGYQSLQAPRPSRTYPPGVQSIFANQNYGNDAAPPVPSVPKEYYDSSGSNQSPTMNGNGGDPSPTSEEGSISTGATSSIGGGLRTMSSKEEVGAWRRFDGHE
ncbi:BQ2448_5310 [Microbotryum intermedium]|uniref:BQ2448_5310 protein n=1 Tax=Microbotryum intermedium TaxID=269621 RepID=A0A238F4Q0_9BASI|nr:BQ2448_5310 [Microbotryum intermedium]